MQTLYNWMVDYSVPGHSKETTYECISPTTTEEREEARRRGIFLGEVSPQSSDPFVHLVAPGITMDLRRSGELILHTLIRLEDGTFGDGHRVLGFAPSVDGRRSVYYRRVRP